MTTSKQAHLQVSQKKGFALLVAVLIASIVLAVGLSIANISLKQFIFAGIGEQSEIAFYAADAGMECALYWDNADTAKVGGKNRFAIGNVGAERDINCMNVDRRPTLSSGGAIDSGEISSANFDWNIGDQNVCTKITVVKYSDPSGVDIPDTTQDCPSDATCTVIESRGYNRACGVVNAGTDRRTVERALRARY